MIRRVWLLGSRRIYPFSSPTAMAQRAGRAQLRSAQVCWQGSLRASAQTLPRDPALTGLHSAPGDREDTRAHRLSQRPADTALGNLIYSYKKALWSL